MSFHEDYHRKEIVPRGSERTFGIVIASVLSIVGMLKGINNLLGVAIVLFLLAFLKPTVLKPLNYVWHNLGLFLHRIMSPLILFVLFAFVFIPIGALMRLFGQRPLVMSPSKSVKSYWRKSETSQFENQF